MNITITRKPFNIPNELQNEFTPEKIQERLYIINQSCSGQYYIVDYCHRKIFVPSPYTLILCGYKQKIMEYEGFDFYSRIFTKDECEWLEKMNQAAFQLYYKYSIFQRKRIVVYYDLVATTVRGDETILRHKVMPYQLCKNGNVWLALCQVTISSKRKDRKAIFVNTAANEKYQFMNDEFVLLTKAIISAEEMCILNGLIRDLTDKQIATEMSLSTDNLKWKKRRLFKKLDVHTSAGAIHEAHLLGIF